MVRTARRYWLVGVAITIVMIAVLVAPGSTQEAKKEPYKIGGLFSLTGYLSMNGEDEMRGATMAIEEINAAGGINGHPLQLIIEDEKSTADAAVASATKLINEDKVLMILHGQMTGAASAVKPIADRAKIPFMTLTCYDPIVLTEGERDKWFFHPEPTPAENVRKILSYIVKETSARRIGLIQDTGFFCTLLKESLMQQTPPLGFKIVAHEQYATRDIDVTAQMTKIREAKPEIVINAGTVTGPAITAKAMKLLGMKLPLYTFQATFGKVLEQSAEATEGIVFLSYRVHVWKTLPADDPYHDSVVKWMEKHYARFGKYLNWQQGDMAYDAVNIIALALKKSGPDRAKLRDALETIKYRGVGTTWSFSPTNHVGAEDPLVYATVKGGKLQFLRR